MDVPSFTSQDTGLVERLVRVFTHPRASYAAVRQRETSLDWFAPALLATLVGLACHFVTLPITMDMEAPAVLEQLDGLSEEERAEAVENMQKMREMSWLAVPVGVFSTLVIVSGILLFVARSVFSSDVTYQQMLIAKGYACMVLVPEWLVRTVLTLMKKSPVVFTGLGAFVPPELARTFAGRILIGLDVFDFWQAWLMGIGLAVMAEISSKRAIIAVMVLWGLWLIAGSAVETMRTAMPPPDPAAAPAPPPG